MSQKERCINELKLAGLFDDDSDYDGGVGRAVERLINTHFDERHSGLSNGHCADLFHRLVTGGVLTPLTGEDDEWAQPTEDLLQNKRDCRVFKDVDTGLAYMVSDGSKPNLPIPSFPFTPPLRLKG